MGYFFFAVGTFQGAYPIEVVSSTYSKRKIAIDNGESFNNILVVDLAKTESRDNTGLCNNFKIGDKVRIGVDVVTRKTKDGKWFPSLTCFSITAHIEQTADGFLPPEELNEPIEDPVFIAPRTDTPF